jgi:hypothetical protein
MPTTNLISKTIGQTLIQSGTGVPDHVAPISTLYYNNTNNMVWVNETGLGSGWVFMTPAMYGELDIDTNTTLSTPGGVNVFISLSGLTWVNYNNNLKGFTKSGNKLVLNSGCTGTYRIIGNLGVLRNATTNDYKIGVSINGAVPALNAQSSTGTFETKTSGHGTVILDRVLNSNDTVELTVAATINGSATFRVRDANLIIYRIYS